MVLSNILKIFRQAGGRLPAGNRKAQKALPSPVGTGEGGRKPDEGCRGKTISAQPG